MPLALLLSPDDQAVSAITAVLEEMSVNCERPLDGVSAAKQLNSHNFDLVLVDCENLPAAKLIFDVCRRGKGGNNAVPIAIVEGRAGLPTAFRLGAELILTKPVAKDQARSTIRTAVGRIRRDEPMNTVPASAASKPVETLAAEPGERETNQAEGLLTNYEVSHAPAPEPRAMVASAAGTAASVNTPSASQSPALKFELKAAEAAKAGTPNKATSSVPNEELTEDPVMADLERAERGEIVPEPHPRLFTAYSEEKKSRRPLVALFGLVLAGGGFYAAWMYQPGFKESVKPQIERVLSLVGTSSPAKAPAPAPAPAPPKPSAQPVPPAGPASPTDSTEPAQPANGDSGTAPASGSAPAAASPISGAPVSKETPAPQTSQPASTSNQASGTAHVITARASVDVPLSLQNTSATTPIAAGKSVMEASSEAELPGEKGAVILSSKGAEKRLIHSVRATYPAAARGAGADGTVVVKTVVNERGSVAAARAVEGNPVLASAAVAAVKQWRYRPYVRDGRTLPFQTVVLVDFQKP